jgi:hypothetical protein
MLKNKVAGDDVVEQRLGDVMGLLEGDPLDRGNPDHGQAGGAGGGDTGR